MNFIYYLSVARLNNRTGIFQTEYPFLAFNSVIYAHNTDIEFEFLSRKVCLQCPNPIMSNDYFVGLDAIFQEKRSFHVFTWQKTGLSFTPFIALIMVGLKGFSVPFFSSKLVGFFLGIDHILTWF